MMRCNRGGDFGEIKIQYQILSYSKPITNCVRLSQYSTLHLRSNWDINEPSRINCKNNIQSQS